MWPIYTMEYYSAIKKNDFSTFAATWMALEEIILKCLLTLRSPVHFLVYLRLHHLLPVLSWFVNKDRVRGTISSVLRKCPFEELGPSFQQ
uniref:DUF1725 domain-containing protein n=1 Tax=Ursus americanus TaxID=9643 RepID=A0A452QGS3_URSAM